MSTKAQNSCRTTNDPVQVRDIGTVEYLEAWDLQRKYVEERAEELGPDTLLLLEHPSVYTAGKRTRPEDYPIDGSRVVDVDRGGRITWHGPGQLVGYPLVKLAEPIDVLHYVRRVEEALIHVCDSFGLDTGRVEGRSGVWLPAQDGAQERKIAAIGVRVQRGVTMHGFELNCNPDLSAFNTIVPCGINDAGVTSLSAEVGRDIPVATALPTARDAILAALDGELPISDRWIARTAPAETTASE